MPVHTDFFQKLVIEGGGLDKFNNITTDRLMLSCSMSLTVDQASELSIEFNDPDLAFAKSFANPKAKPGEDRGPIGKKAMYGTDMPLAVSAMSLGPGPAGIGGTTLKLLPGGVYRSMNIKGALTRNDLTPTQYAKDAAAHAGMKFVGENSPKRPSIVRDVAAENDKSSEASDWTTVKRLAAEEGFLVYECLNTLYFATPQWLFDKQPTHTLGLGGLVTDDNFRLMEMPSIEMSSLKKDDDEVSFRLPIKAAGRILPGHSVTIKGIPGMGDKKLLVTSIDYPLVGVGDLTLKARHPWKIEKQSQAGQGGGGGGLMLANYGSGAGPVLPRGGARVNGLTAAAHALKVDISRRFNIPMGNIGGYRPEDGYGEHSTGRALDVMTYSDVRKGYAVKDYVMANARNFGLKWMIWQQRMWYPGGRNEGMGDRGSPTQNHMDHVHIFIDR